MNRELPKPLQEALARSSRTEAGEAHPSADLLTAFVERSLPPTENQRITVHLAACADCREVVFLTTSAIEGPVGEEQEAPRRRVWRLWWVWAPAIVVVLIVSGVVLQQRSEFGGGERMTVAVKAPAPGPSASQPSSAVAPAPEAEKQLVLKEQALPERPKSVANTARAQTEQAQGPAKKLPEGKLTVRAYEEAPPAPAAASQSANAPAPGALAGAAAAPAAAPTYNSFAEGEGQTPSALAGQLRLNMEKPPAATRSVSGLRSQWRVTPDGRLEHSTAPGSWTPVLADQPTVFHVVSVVGNNVWAGGNSGALFHSIDGGETWNQRPLAGKTGTIVSIHFSDIQHGVVISDSGGRWSTSDGGVTWNRQ